jgi:acylphosphatase
MAKSLGLSGWVRNLYNGTVEAVISGPEDAVKDLIDACYDGPEYARVENITISDGEYEGSTVFEQRPSAPA